MLFQCLEHEVDPHLGSRRVAVVAALPTTSHVTPVERPHRNSDVKRADNGDVGKRENAVGNPVSPEAGNGVLHGRIAGLQGQVWAQSHVFPGLAAERWLAE